MENISLKLFLNEIAGLIDQKEEIRVQEMGELIMKWKRLLESFRQSCKSQADEYREWYYLKLSVEWIKESLALEKKSPFLI
ncbi:MAG: hypothetical protein K0M50_06135 [Prolixibacteraceae bacterium]|nr:hypothetical protein [Prolixibacteraceae bacterium]